MELKLGEKQTLTIVKKVEFDFDLNIFIVIVEILQIHRVCLPHQTGAGGSKGRRGTGGLPVSGFQRPPDRHYKNTEALPGTGSTAYGSTGRKSGSIPGLGTGEGSVPALQTADQESKSRRSGAGFPLYRQKRQTLRNHECL